MAPLFLANPNVLAGLRVQDLGADIAIHSVVCDGSRFLCIEKLACTSTVVYGL